MDCPTNLGYWWNVQVLDESLLSTPVTSTSRTEIFFLSWQISCINTWCCNGVYVQRDARMYKSLALRDLRAPKRAPIICISETETVAAAVGTQPGLHLLDIHSEGTQPGLHVPDIHSEDAFAPQELGKPSAPEQLSACQVPAQSNPTLTVLKPVFRTCCCPGPVSPLAARGLTPVPCAGSCAEPSTSPAVWEACRAGGAAPAWREQLGSIPPTSPPGNLLPEVFLPCSLRCSFPIRLLSALPSSSAAIKALPSPSAVNGRFPLKKYLWNVVGFFFSQSIYILINVTNFLLY